MTLTIYRGSDWRFADHPRGPFRQSAHLIRLHSAIVVERWRDGTPSLFKGWNSGRAILVMPEHCYGYSEDDMKPIISHPACKSVEIPAEIVKP
jgi:hypothetical protein